MRRLVLAALVALLAASCATRMSPPSPSPSSSPETTIDPGLAGCAIAAQRAEGGNLPTDVERVRVWQLLESSEHEDLRVVGQALRSAWTRGDLQDQLAANTNAQLACAAHGIEVPFP